VLAAAIGDAARLGYSTLAVSGGEPFLYAPLGATLAVARAHGMTTTLTTNGTILTEPRVAQVAGRVDLVAVSLDGVPASHDRMRASPRAFALMAARLDLLRRARIPFGFIFTLTLHNVHELEWVARFAAEQGARLLQIHPLEETGRAVSALAGSAPDAVEGAYAFLESLRLQEKGRQRSPRIQLDLVNGVMVAGDPDAVLSEPAPAGEDRLFADLLSPLVIEADGSAVPLSYGFSRRFALGNIHAAPLHRLAAHWRARRYPAFRRLCRRVYRQMVGGECQAMVNWYELVSRAAAGGAGRGATSSRTRRPRPSRVVA
jgi:MoaA/NifB/PqqE/SkfB family radical SAM enzyme